MQEEGLSPVKLDYHGLFMNTADENILVSCLKGTTDFVHVNVATGRGVGLGGVASLLLLAPKMLGQVLQRARICAARSLHKPPGSIKEIYEALARSRGDVSSCSKDSHVCRDAASSVWTDVFVGREPIGDSSVPAREESPWGEGEENAAVASLQP